MPLSLSTDSMEGIVTKVLGAYLNKFIKGFNKEMLSLQIMKGQATMKDFGSIIIVRYYCVDEFNKRASL